METETRTSTSIVRTDAHCQNMESYIHIFSAECACSLVISQFRTTICSYLHNILVFYFTCLNNKNSNVQLQFLSLCRLQQLAMPSRLAVVLVSLLVATPVTIFWLWLMILPTSVTIQCPEECRCVTDGYYVDCLGSGLNSILSILHKHVRELKLDGNNIHFLKRIILFLKDWLSWRQFKQTSVTSRKQRWEHSAGFQS